MRATVNSGAGQDGHPRDPSVFLRPEARAWVAFLALADERGASARSTFTWMVAQCLALEGRTLADACFDRGRRRQSKE